MRAPGTGGDGFRLDDDDAPLDIEGQAEAAARPSPIATLRGTGDVFRTLPPIPWLCQGLRLVPGAPVLIAGYGFSGKTAFVQDVGLCVTSGLPVLGLHPVDGVGGILHLDYEQGAYLTDDRYQRLAKARGIIREQVEGRLHVVNHPDVYLDDKDAEDRLRATLDTLKNVRLLIVDSFRAACPATKEKESEARVPLDMLGRVCEPRGIVPAVIVHCRKPSKEDLGGPRMAIRGSGAIYDAAGGVFVFDGDKDKPKAVYHEKEKMRGVTIPTFGVRFADTENGGLLVEHLTEAELSASQNDPQFARRCQAVLTLVRQHADGIGGRDFDAALKGITVRASDGRACALHLAATGHVTMTTKGGRKYSPIEGKTEYAPPATGTIGVEDHAVAGTNGVSQGTAFANELLERV